MILVHIDRRCKIPIYKQLLSQLLDLIHRGVLKPGDILPSSRSLAENHGLSRSTVIRVYDELWAAGYIDSKPGSYSKIRQRKEFLLNNSQPYNGSINWGNISSARADEIYECQQNFHFYTRIEKRTNTIIMSRLALDERIFPADLFRKCLNRVFLEKMTRIFNYHEPQGYKPLREFISKRLQIHGISTSPDEILITNGSQNSLEIILKLFTVPGSEVIIESPTYFFMLPLIQFYGVNTIPIPMRAGGMDIDYLSKVLKQSKPAFLYTIPNFHNPTGITTSQVHRERLLSISEEHKLPIVEDAFEEEMKYFGKTPFPIKSMDKGQLVLYLGSFSKVFFPGIRIGWIAADKNCIKRLLPLKMFSDIASNLPIQAAIYDFCQEGYYDLHIRKMHRIYRKRMQVAQKALKDNLKAFGNVSWMEPAGGFLIWIKLKNSGHDAIELDKIFLKNGVKVLPGEISFLHGRSKDQFIRISISNLDESEIAEGIHRIGNTLLQIYKM